MASPALDLEPVMAAPKSPWNKQPKDVPNGQNAPAPGANKNKQDQQLSTTTGLQTINCKEEQQNEVEALRSIYMDDYEEVEVRGAWSKISERAFKLRVRATSDRETFVSLSVKLTATYPKTLPLLSVQGAEGLIPKTQQAIQKLLTQKPKELVRDQQPMIFEIASSIEEILEDAVQSRERQEQIPSLEEERAVSEAAASSLARQQEAEELRRKEEAIAEEDRMLKHMVDDEISRRREAKRRSRMTTKEVSLPTDETLDDSAIIGFDQPISMGTDTGDHLMFRSVIGMSLVAQGKLSEVCLVRPLVAQALAPPLVYKRTELKPKSQGVIMKDAVMAFEKELEALKSLRDDNVVSVLAYNIERLKPDSTAEGWEIGILTEYANKGSLSDLLEINTLPIDKVRSWTRALLEAIDFYRRHGVVHGRIHPGNVLMHRVTSGATTVKLADAAYQASLNTLNDLSRGIAQSVTARSAYWVPTELAQQGSRPTHKTDVWDLGIVFLQMMFGLNILEKYTSPATLMEAVKLSEPLEDIIRKFFRADSKKRPTAFDLIPSEFIRNDVPIFDPTPTVSPIQSRYSSSAHYQSITMQQPRRVRHDSTTASTLLSRYAAEWDELGRIGKGGYGEVVRARNKLDGRIYAIKKIKAKSAAELDGVLSEVMLLSRLNHPYVVRYFSARTEDDVSQMQSADEDAVSSTDETSLSDSVEAAPIGAGLSSAGLDFVSSGGYPHIEFGDDSEEEDEFSVDSASDGNNSEPEKEADSVHNIQREEQQPKLQLQRVRSNSRVQRQVKTTLYIQMEYCERQTLRDLIRNDLYKDVDKSWRLFRQVLEGLAHIHSHGIIHRDLKPENIFIDTAGNPRIGDFGLATTGQVISAEKVPANDGPDADLTRSLGTAFYIAPELRSEAGGHYNEKVDMYSLGIIFFEMCYPPLKTDMERHQVLSKLREKTHALPSDFQTSGKAAQGEIILSLINHRPNERPASAELLRSGKLPVPVEDETIRLALQGISDPSSPYYQRMMTALFTQPASRQIKDYTWDMTAGQGNSQDALIQSLAKEELIQVFRRHGALETHRQLLFPRSAYYVNENIVQMLDNSGTLVQLPYDLTLPYARSIARKAPPCEKSYAFGKVFRDTYSGSAPRSSGEVDFDIVSYDTLDLAMKEAETIKVLDEIIAQVPSLSTAQICFHVNHSDLLELIMDFCRISVPQRSAAKEVLSKLNIEENTWQKIRSELRSPSIGVSSTSLDDLARFDFRDVADKAFAKLRSIFEGTEYVDRTHAMFSHLSTVLDYMKRFRVRRKTYISPLSSFKDKFYAGGIMFQCLYDTKRSAVLAAGGRYDKLIEDHSPRAQGMFTGAHAVGFNLGWERLVTSMAKYERTAGKAFLKKPEEDLRGLWATPRCDILVASFDPAVLRSAGANLVSDLWANDLSAELAIDARSAEELNAHYRDEKHSWWIIIKHDASGTGMPDLKIRSQVRKEDVDVRSSELMSYFRAAIRDRDRRGQTAERAKPLRQPSHPDTVTHHQHQDRKAEVKVLIASHKGKKSNKYKIIESAYARTYELTQSLLDAPIAAVEIRDEVLEMIRKDARLSDAESWRRVVQSVRLEEREYLGQVWDLLERCREEYKKGGDGVRWAFLYNWRTGLCGVYDLEV